MMDRDEDDDEIEIPDEIEEEFDEEPAEELGSDDSGPVNPPRFSPVFTGILDSTGRPIIKHPVVIRAGFWPEEQKFYCPTKENKDDPSVVGWFYEVL